MHVQVSPPPRFPAGVLNVWETIAPPGQLHPPPVRRSLPPQLALGLPLNREQLDIPIESASLPSQSPAPPVMLVHSLARDVLSICAAPIALVPISAPWMLPSTMLDEFTMSSSAL